MEQKEYQEMNQEERTPQSDGNNKHAKTNDTITRIEKSIA